MTYWDNEILRQYERSYLEPEDIGDYEPEEEEEEEKTVEPLDISLEEAYDEIIKTAWHLKKLCATMGRCDNCPFCEYDQSGSYCHFMTTEPINWEVEN